MIFLTVASVLKVREPFVYNTNIQIVSWKIKKKKKTFRRPAHRCQDKNINFKYLPQRTLTWFLILSLKALVLTTGPISKTAFFITKKKKSYHWILVVAGTGLDCGMPQLSAQALRKHCEKWWPPVLWLWTVSSHVCVADPALFCLKLLSPPPIFLSFVGSQKGLFSVIPPFIIVSMLPWSNSCKNVTLQ